MGLVFVFQIRVHHAAQPDAVISRVSKGKYQSRTLNPDVRMSCIKGP